MSLSQDCGLIRSDLSISHVRPWDYVVPRWSIVAREHWKQGRWDDVNDILGAGVLSKTYLVGGISVLDDSVSTNNNTVNVIMLHQRAEHGVT
jgi:hypothetical protein